MTDDSRVQCRCGTFYDPAETDTCPACGTRPRRSTDWTDAPTAALADALDELAIDEGVRPNPALLSEAARRLRRLTGTRMSATGNTNSVVVQDCTSGGDIIVSAGPRSGKRRLDPETRARIADPDVVLRVEEP